LRTPKVCLFPWRNWVHAFRGVPKWVWTFGPHKSYYLVLLLATFRVKWNQVKSSCIIFSVLYATSEQYSAPISSFYYMIIFFMMCEHMGMCSADSTSDYGWQIPDSRRQPNICDKIRSQISSLSLRSSQHQRDGSPKIAISMAYAVQTYVVASYTHITVTRKRIACCQRSAEVLPPIRYHTPLVRERDNAALWQGI
jgi:hypothetical protein